MAANYLGFAQAVNASNPMAEGLRQLGATIEARRERERLAPQEAQAATLRNLQIQQAQSGINETVAKRNALSDLYGTKGQPDEYARALAFQAQEENMQKEREVAQGKAKFAMDGYMKVSEAVKNGLIPEGQAGSFYHNALRMAGVDLDKSGVKMEFKKQGGYYSGPVTPDSLFMVNGKPTPYGGTGTIGKARIAGIDPTTNKPIFEMTADTTFAESRPDQEAMIDKRFANQQKLTQMQIDAQDRRAAADRASAERRSANKPDATDAFVAREAVKDLPKLRREARTAEASKPRLAQMIQLLDSGAGGLKGNALAAISGVFDTPATSEAELFKKLAAAGAGQLRTAVIGPGAVSNYEQSLLQAISGGGNGARTATRQLLKFYDQEADRTISNYNDAVDSAVTVAPKAAKGFGKLGAKQSSGGGKGKKPLSSY